MSGREPQGADGGHAAGGPQDRATPWDAHTYDRVSEPQLEWAAAVLERLEGLPADATVLDVGCGTGRVTELLPDLVPEGRVLALDASPEMVELARERLGGRAEVFCSDVLELRLDEQVDAIISTATLHWVRDHERLWPVLGRALSDGGRLEVQCGGAGNIAGVRETIDRVARELAPELVGFSPWNFASAQDTSGRLARVGLRAGALLAGTAPHGARGPTGVHTHLDPGGPPRATARRAARTVRRCGRRRRTPAARLRTPERLRQACDPRLMASTFTEIDERLADWIAAQALFFVGSAPLGADGHINVSPKGPIETLRVLGPQTVAYLDLVGSGAETIAHLRENGRIVVMLCAFDGPPRILRLHGHGEVVVPGDDRFEQLMSDAGFQQPSVPESRRAIVLVQVTRIADSCGYGVPLMSYEGRRPHMDAWAEKKVRVGGPEALLAYQQEKNAASIDGLPAVEVRETAAP